jgi:SAM-dependent methyltransferase
VLTRRAWYVVTKINRGAGGGIVSVSVGGSHRATVAIEAIGDYRAATAESVAAVQAATKIAPLVNYPGDSFVHITQAQWAKLPKDYAGTTKIEAGDAAGAHRVRSALGTFLCRDAGAAVERHRYHSVFITDAKRADPPPPPETPTESARLRPVPVLPADAPDEPRADVVEGQPDLAAMRATLKAGVKVVVAPQLFPTPTHIADQMAALADIRPGHRILEPSAGTGHLLDAAQRRIGQRIGAQSGCEIVAVELNLEAVRWLRGRSPQQTPETIISGDFLEMDNGEARCGVFDVILMNPPFENGADIKHILHARSFLKPGGRLVAICANGPRRAEKLRPLASIWEPLRDGTFADQGTNVRTVLLAMETPEVVADPGPSVTRTVARPAKAKPASAERFDLFHI